MSFGAVLRFPIGPNAPLTKDKIEPQHSQIGDLPQLNSYYYSTFYMICEIGTIDEVTSGMIVSVFHLVIDFFLRLLKVISFDINLLEKHGN